LIGLKNVFEVERFSGQSVLSIEQDFYEVIFLATLQSILSKGTEEEFEGQKQRRPSRYAKQVNQSVGYSAMLELHSGVVDGQEQECGADLRGIAALVQDKSYVASGGTTVSQKEGESKSKVMVLPLH